MSTPRFTGSMESIASQIEAFENNIPDGVTTHEWIKINETPVSGQMR